MTQKPTKREMKPRTIYFAYRMGVIECVHRTHTDIHITMMVGMYTLGWRLWSNQFIFLKRSQIQNST